jgi:hypothetical protein
LNVTKLRTAEIARLLQVTTRASSNMDKGRALEGVGRLVFASVRGIELRATNTVSVFKSEELDAAIFVEECKDIPLRSMVVLVECKNWRKPIGSREVGWFVAKLRKRGVKDGILLAAHGVTGDSGKLTSAHDEIQAALMDGIRVLVITCSEILSLATTDDVLRLLRQKQVDLVTRRTSIPK